MLILSICYACINIKLEGGGDPGICGAFDFYYFPHLWEGGDVCFFWVEEWDQVTSSHVNNGKNLPKAKPPSEILLEAHKKWKGIPDNSALLAIAKEALFPPEEVCLWLKHLENVACNRKRGQRKQQPNGKNVKPI